MPVLDVQNVKGKQISQVELADDVFSVPVKSSVLHEVVTMQLANRRAGTAAVKHRSDIRGSRKKLYRQKGTGRARQGTIRAAQWRGGGVVFGPSPRDYTTPVPRKVRQLAGNAVAHGMPAQAALAALTRVPAEVFGADPRVITRGARADLVIWSGDPLSTYSIAEQTWIDGRKYFDREQDLARREAALAEREALIAKARSFKEKPEEEEGEAGEAAKAPESPKEEPAEKDPKKAATKPDNKKPTLSGKPTQEAHPKTGAAE